MQCIRLIEGYWPRQGAGILGGPPKGAKSVLALEAAVSIASGTPFLQSGRVVEPGPVLVASLEGGRWLATDRLEKICRHRGLEMATLPVHVMDLGQLSRLRLDDPRYMRGLKDAAQRFVPKLIILDPLVRLHGGSENSASDISALLENLRVIQVEVGCAIMLVHHNKRNVAKESRPGEDFRGSGDLHAWGDTNWSIRGDAHKEVTLKIEHRAAGNPNPVRYKLVVAHDESTMHLALVTPGPADDSEQVPNAELGLRHRALTKITEGAIGFGALRDALGVSAGNLSTVCKALDVEGLIEKDGRRWRLRSVPTPSH